MKVGFPKHKLIIFAVVCLLILAACGPETTTVNGRQCLAPKLEAITTEVPLFWDTNQGNDPRRIPDREAIPQWMVATLTRQQQDMIAEGGSPVDMTVVDDFVWLAYRNFVVRYNLLTKKLDRYNINENGTMLEISDLLVTRDHDLWMAGTWLSKSNGYAFLFRYDPETDLFIAIDDEDGLLTPRSNREDLLGNGKDRVLKEGQNGNLFFLFNKGIYSYNPSSNQAAMIYIHPKLPVISIETDSRDYIWFIVEGDDKPWLLRPGLDNPESFMLPEFYPGTDYLLGLYYRHGYTLYMDSQQRLWVPAWGYLDTQQEPFTWHILKPNPLFVFYYDLDYVYDWDRIESVILQDNSIWFSSQNGVIHYDPQNETACWISPESGLIAMTPDNELLMLINNQLYVYAP